MERIRGEIGYSVQYNKRVTKKGGKPIEKNIMADFKTKKGAIQWADKLLSLGRASAVVIVRKNDLVPVIWKTKSSDGKVATKIK